MLYDRNDSRRNNDRRMVNMRNFFLFICVMKIFCLEMTISLETHRVNVDNEDLIRSRLIENIEMLLVSIGVWNSLSKAANIRILAKGDHRFFAFRDGNSRSIDISIVKVISIYLSLLN